MPVYDYAYKTWEGTRRGAFFRWFAIPKFTFMEFWGRRVFVGLFTAAWLQVVIRLAYMYILGNLQMFKSLGIEITSAERLPQIGASFFKDMIDLQLPFCFLFAFMMGSNLISRDLKNNAMVLYAAKPVSRWEYFIGKFSVLFGLVLVITWFQVLFLFAIQILISPAGGAWRARFMEEYYRIPFSALLYCCILGASLSLLILTASSMTKNARYAGPILGFYLVGTAMIGGFLDNVTREHACFMISPVACVDELGQSIFGLKSTGSGLTFTQAWIGMLGSWTLCGGILGWNISRAAKGTH